MLKLTKENKGETRMNKSIPINRTKALSLLYTTGGRFFSAAFNKKDGSYRKMTARTGVKKWRKTKTKRSFAHKHNNPYFLVGDIHKGEYRVINLETLHWVKYGGITYVISDGIRGIS